MWTTDMLAAFDRGTLSSRTITQLNMPAYQAIANSHAVEEVEAGEWRESRVPNLSRPLRVQSFKAWAVVDCSGAACFYRSKPIPSDIPSGSRLVKLGEIDE